MTNPEISLEKVDKKHKDEIGLHIPEQLQKKYPFQLSPYSIPLGHFGQSVSHFVQLKSNSPLFLKRTQYQKHHTQLA